MHTYTNKTVYPKRDNGEELILPYLKDFSYERSLSLEYFEQHNAQEIFNQISSSSSLRKIYDSYMDILQKEGEKNDIDMSVQIDIWMAKVAYQGARNIVPSRLANFFNKIYTKNLNKDAKKFRDFLEVFVAYHKFFNQKAK